MYIGICTCTDLYKNIRITRWITPIDFLHTIFSCKELYRNPVESGEGKKYILSCASFSTEQRKMFFFHIGGAWSSTNSMEGFLEYATLKHFDVLY